jgi:hypothetical protein
MKFISTIFLLFGLLLSDSAFAQPGRIGYDDCLHKLQDLELKDPEGEELFLGYRTTITWFVFGIYLKDQGYILAVKGNRTEGACVGNEEGQYYDLNEDDITRLQSEGSLPIPLPNYEIDVLFYALGYSLWLIIAGIAGFSGLISVFKKKSVPDDTAT